MIYYVGNWLLFEDATIKQAKVKDCLAYFKDHKRIEVDTETTGRDRFEGKVITLQIGDLDNQYVIDLRIVPIGLFKELLESKIIIGQNFSFDYKFLKANGIIVKNIYDTMIAESVLYCGYRNWGYGLNALTMRYLNISLDKSIREDFSTIGANPFSVAQITYMADDVKYLSKIKSYQDMLAKERDLGLTIALENKVIPALAEIEYNGMKINVTQWLDYEKVVFKEKRELELKLDEILIEAAPHYFAPHMFVGKKGREELVPYQDDMFGMYTMDRKTGVNWNSDQQVKKILREVFEFEAMGKDGKVSLNSVVLGKVKVKPPIINMLISYAEKAKEVSTYGKAFIEQYLKPDGRAHTSFWQIKATGRVSSGNRDMGAHNSQNIPEAHRAFFEAEEGRSLVICDYSAQEPRITADKCQDPKLLDFVLNGDGDSHALIASAVFTKIYGEPITVTKKDDPYEERFKATRRQVGKTINLGLDYGKTAYSIKDDLGVSQEEAQEFIDGIKEAFPGKEAYFKQVIKDMWNRGYILHDTVIKRKTYIPEFEFFKNKLPYSSDSDTKKKYFSGRGGLERDAQNYGIQGTAASMTKLALAYIQEIIWNNPKFNGTMLVNVVHDEIVAEVDDDQAEAFAEVMVECMVRAGKVFCKTVPMKVDPVISKNWVK